MPIVVVALALVGVFAERVSPATNGANVLLINAYHTGYQWSDRIVDGIRESLRDGAPQAQLYVEHLDSKRIYAQPAFDRLADLIREK